MKKNLFRCLIIGISLISLSFYAGCTKYFSKGGDELHIAVAGPMTGDSEAVGRAFVQGVKLYVNDVNRRGGINGKRVVIDIYDDQNRAELARGEAFKIADSSQVLAVIGHHYSSCSIAAGEIYKDYGIPAISPASTNVKVTWGNPWYFRSSFNDYIQGRFLANYARMVFKKTTASIIYENDDYGRYLASVFEKTFKELGSEIKYKWRFSPKDRLMDDNLKRIVYDLKSKDDAGVIFVATHAGPGIKILKLMKDVRIFNSVMGPDAFASEAFRKGFDIYPKERRNPGYYTNGMYVTTPLIFDTTNEKGQVFREIYEKTYGETPGWHAAFAYDTAMVVVHALKNAHIAGTAGELEEDRRKIRNFLAGMNSIENAVEGVTGYNYFDKRGDSQKPVLIGVYKNQNIVSALTQFQTVSNPAELSYINESRKKDRIIFFDGHYMYRINVVYTGIDVKEIRELNFKDLTCYMDFFLWIRYQGGDDLNKLVFLNSVDPIKIDNSVYKGKLKNKDEKNSAKTEVELVKKRITKDNLQYYLYHIQGRFRMDFIPGRNVYGEHIVGISFRHPDMDRNNLIYVRDVLGMGNIHDEKDLIVRLEKNQVLSKATGWKMKGIWFFQDMIEENPLGNPEYLNISNSSVNFSRFNAGIRIVPDKFVLRNIVPQKWVGNGLVISIFMIILLFIIRRTKTFSPFVRLIWLFQLVFVFILLLSGEYYLIGRLGDTYYIQPLIIIFNILWWIIPAVLLVVGINHFIWMPLEEKTGRSVPKIIRNSAALIVFVLAFFGIVAFVFDQRLTSLLATSGVIAMIIGLAIQINISNIFSGIAINMERPFRVGDWIRIDDFKEGKVVDINWRTTRIKTRDDTLLCIPNSKASESPIENFSYPDNGYYKYFTIHVDPAHPPERVKKILLDAALSTDGVEKEPPPSTRFLGLTAGMTGQSESWAANYLVSIYVKDYGEKFAHNEALWTNIWTHLRRAGIKHVIQRQEMLMVIEGVRKKKAITSGPIALIEDIDIFRPFSARAKNFLARRMKRHHCYPGQIIVRQGDTGKSLFIIEEGVVSIRVKFDTRTKPIEVARMGAGNFFGEMALLTGEKRTATIVSLTESYLYEITKEDIAPLIESEPRISRLLSGILTNRKMATESQKYSDDDFEFDKATLASQIFGKIQTFFGFKR